MRPRLAALDGPLKGQVLPLAEPETMLGRDASNQIRVEDSSASRHHCILRRADSGAITIQDRGSRNGTFVNGVPVTERSLEHGDEIRVGRSLFVFLSSEEEPERSSPRFREYAFAESSTIEIPPFETASRAQAAALSLKPGGAFMQLRTSRRTFDDIAEGILDLSLHVVPADRGALLVMEQFASEPELVCARDRVGRDLRDVPVPRSVIERVLQGSVAVLGRTEVPGAAAIAVIAAPLFSRERPLGVLCLESSAERPRFAFEHLQLTAKMAGVAGAALEAARYVQWLRDENARLALEAGHLEDLIGASARMREVQNFIAKVAPSDSTVLIHGETGTGKELIARAIHRGSPRAGRPFVAINCAALTETLLESELFGHEKGAFTGAIAQKIGKLEAAEGGTVFLDEIGELPPPLQPKLLRALQQREFERVGGTKNVRVDIRLIAATNTDLKKAVADGRFRQDLFYRLNVVSIRMPSLRNRRQDIPLLANYFAAKLAQQVKRRVVGVSPEAMACLLGYDWPGNVRELENAIEHAAVLGSTELILAEDLPESVLDGSTASGAPATFHEAVRRHKKELILSAVEQAHGNCTEAAGMLGLHPNYLHRLITALRLRDAIKRTAGAG